MRWSFAILPLVATTVCAQVPLPLYERWDSTSLLISRDPTAFDSLDRSIDTVTALGPNGREYLKVVGTHVIQVDECCDPKDPEFLLLELERQVVLDRSYTCFLPGVVNDLEPWDATVIPADSVLQDTMELRYNEGRYMRFFWSPDSISGLGLTVQEFDAQGGLHHDRTYATPRTNCVARTRDGFTTVRCSRQASFPGMMWGANFLFLFDNAELVEQFWDWSGTSIDGCGPFAYSYYDVCGALSSAGGAAYVLTSGEVVVHDGEDWSVRSREPVRYYGECDCGE